MQDEDATGASGDGDLAAALVALRHEAEALVKTSDTFKWLIGDVPASLDDRATAQEAFIKRMRESTVQQVSLGDDQTRLNAVLDGIQTEAKLQRGLAKVLRQLAKQRGV